MGAGPNFTECCADTYVTGLATRTARPVTKEPDLI